MLYDESVYPYGTDKEEFQVTWETIAEYYYEYHKAIRPGERVCDEITDYQFDLINPIPLTEEWLERFGFKEKSKWTFVLNTPSGRMLTYHLGTKIIHYGSDGYGSGEINCKYVHQLQNLYHALTGKEL